MAKDFDENSYDRWVWCDLEMTGLDENSCVILQAAMVITDTNLKILSEIELPVWQPESVLATMIPIVKSMHTKNNLLDKVRASEYSLAEVEQKLMQVLTSHVPYQKGILAGNSIYMDRKFLDKYMPVFAGYLHYRQIDVSSIKLLSHAWYGAKGRPPKKVSSHTALQDIKDSIEELKFYKDNIFCGPN